MSREQDIQKLCNAILEMDIEFYDNPNGPYEFSCPFCLARETRKGSEGQVYMDTIKHETSCEYLIAKDVKTNLEEL